MAKTYGQRPSELVGIRDEWAAYQFDAAVLLASVDDGRPGKTAAAVKWDWGDLAR